MYALNKAHQGYSFKRIRRIDWLMQWGLLQGMKMLTNGEIVALSRKELY